MPSLLERPILLGRGVREWLLLAGLALVCVGELTAAVPHWGDLTVYLLLGAALAARLFAARALLVGLVIAAMAQNVPFIVEQELRGVRLRDHLDWLVREWRLVSLWVGALLLVCAPSMVRAFDRSPSRLRWLPNYWARLSPWDARLLRWCGYAVGALFASLVVLWQTSWQRPAWALAALVCLGACLLLLLLGRAFVLILIPLLCGAVFALLLPHAIEAHRAAGLPTLFAPGVFGRARPLLAPALLEAALATALALPYAARVLRRGLRG